MKKLLVVVDMQNDFVTGKLGFPEAKEIIPRIKEKIELYVKDGHEVVFTRDTHYESIYNFTREGRALPVPHCYEDTHGWQVVDELRDDYSPHIDKYTFGLNADDIHYLSGVKTLEIYDSIEIVGLVTNLCVLSVAVCLQSNTKFAEIIVDASCCKSFDPALHEKALDVMEGLQMKVINR
jgi:nicotinamidase-related amidase